MTIRNLPHSGIIYTTFDIGCDKSLDVGACFDEVVEEGVDGDEEGVFWLRRFFKGAGVGLRLWALLFFNCRSSNPFKTVGVEVYSKCGSNSNCIKREGEAIPQSDLAEQVMCDPYCLDFFMLTDAAKKRKIE